MYCPGTMAALTGATGTCGVAARCESRAQQDGDGGCCLPRHGGSPREGRARKGQDSFSEEPRLCESPSVAPALYLPVREQHSTGGVALGIALVAHAQIGPANAVAARDETAEGVPVARLATQCDASDAGLGGRRLDGS